MSINALQRTVSRVTARGVTRKSGPKGKEVANTDWKFGEVVQRVRVPPDQSRARQVGSEPCAGGGNDVGDT